MGIEDRPDIAMALISLAANKLREPESSACHDGQEIASKIYRDLRREMPMVPAALLTYHAVESSNTHDYCGFPTGAISNAFKDLSRFMPPVTAAILVCEAVDSSLTPDEIASRAATLNVDQGYIRQHLHEEFGAIGGSNKK